MQQSLGCVPAAWRGSEGPATPREGCCTDLDSSRFWTIPAAFGHQEGSVGLGRRAAMPLTTARSGGWLVEADGSAGKPAGSKVGGRNSAGAEFWGRRIQFADEEGCEGGQQGTAREARLGCGVVGLRQRGRMSGRSARGRRLQQGGEEDRHSRERRKSVGGGWCRVLAAGSRACLRGGGGWFDGGREEEERRRGGRRKKKTQKVTGLLPKKKVT